MKIAFTGKARAGKDYLADILVSEYGYEKHAFGDALKAYAHEIFPAYPKEPKPRKLYQDFGQYMRQIEPDVWVSHLFDAIEGVEKPVITDLRQPNELDALREAGFIIIAVKCREDERVRRMKESGDAFDPKDLTHETESHTDGFDVDFVIDTTFGKGAEQLRHFMQGAE